MPTLVPRVATLVLVLVAACPSPAPAPGPHLDDLPPPDGERRILFGDLHVHSTYSNDAVIQSVPFVGGPGQSPPEMKCSFARYCSQLDFWAATDHAEGLAPSAWQRTREAVRTCNAENGGYTTDPDMVTFLGWEWTNSADMPTAHFGHKNVILADTYDDRVPARPIAASASPFVYDPDLIRMGVSLLRSADPEHESDYEAAADQIAEGAAVSVCPMGIDTRDLAASCSEEAADPAELFEKLDQWGFPAIVIPHGTAWGMAAPTTATWTAQLDARNNNGDYQRLVEVYSGHGSSEVYRAWQESFQDEDGNPVCPPPTTDYLPCCWQAGEIARARSATCVAAPEGAACQTEVVAARNAFLAATTEAVRFGVVGDSTASDWLDCGACRDCELAAYDYRPDFSVQSALARMGFLGDGTTTRFRWGLIGSSDSHRAGPGTGYRERREDSDSMGPARADFDELFGQITSLLFTDYEREESYLYTGGLVGVHAYGRSRRAIWEALERREVFGTTGERMELTFDLTSPTEDGETMPMGSEVVTDATPSFQVTAVGSWIQAAGCPERTVAEAPAGFIDEYCFGECYNPTDERYQITRIEVVKIEPQITADELVSERIEDPFLVFECDPSPDGCTITFDDPAFVDAGRSALYYVRAYQEATPVFAAGGVRCTYDDAGACISVNPCPTGYHGDTDDCLVETEEYAFSSPIFVDPVDRP